MKRLLLSSALLLALAAGGYSYKAAAETSVQAQAAQPVQPGGDGWADNGPGDPGFAPGPDADPGGPGGPAGHRPGFPPRPGFGPGPGQGFWHADRMFALFPHVPDKKLTPADVKTIATALLLDQGKHSWTVTNVAAQADKSISFSFASQHGDVIASFKIDPATGRIDRTG